MPRRNPERRRPEERWAAERIEWEQKQRGWTNAQLAEAMTKVGCHLDPSAMYKIYRGSPRRSISVEELAAFSEVLDVPVQDLLQPVRVHYSKQLNTLLERLKGEQIELTRQYAIVDQTIRELVLLSADVNALSFRLVAAAARREACMYELTDICLEVEEALEHQEERA